MSNPSDPWALARYQVISALIALPPPRGRGRDLLELLAARAWPGPDGEPFRVRAETIRVWARRYRQGGLAALADKSRPKRGVAALTEAEQELLCRLKRGVCERSLDQLIRIAEDLGHITPGKARRSTVHRVLVAAGISARKAKALTAKDLDRFEADFVNEIWQSDMLDGPWLPDPARPGKTRQAWLYTYLDDHSRRGLHGRFSFKGDLPALELVFRRSMQKYGVPTRVYYDNGSVYKSDHMRQIIAAMGIHGRLFTEVRRPEGHGKIEAFNRNITNNFIAEVKASSITTLDQLNEAWLAWMDGVYNVTIHTETGEKPLDRWRAGLADVRFADENRLRNAFLWSEIRTPDKSGIFSLFGTEYQTGPALAKKRIQVRYDPEGLDEIEVWYDQRFVERVRPFVVSRHRRPPIPEPAPPVAGPTPNGDWLGHLVEKRRKDNFVEPTPAMIAEVEAAQRAAAQDAVLAVLAERLDPAVLDPAATRAFLDRFGPWDADAVAASLDQILTHQPRDLHCQVYLDLIHTQLKGHTP